MLSRAQYWVRMRFTYGTVFVRGRVVHTETKPDQAGKAYRTDCSGLVSMAWHLTMSRTTLDFARWSGTVKLPSIHDLKPGDALLRPGHIELFARWVTPGRHEDGAFVYSFNRTGETVQNPDRKTNRGNIGRNSFNDMGTYTPLRYRHALDDSTNTHANSAFLREPNGKISVVAGGAPFHLTPQEYAALGSPPWVAVPAGTFTRMPGIIQNGALLRVSDGTIFVIAGSAKYPLSAAEWAAMGRPHFVQVPRRVTDALDGVPADNTFLRDPAAGSIYHIVGEAKYPLTAADYTALGNPGYTNVPVGFIDSIKATVPEGTLFLRDCVNGAIHVVVGGAKYHLSPAEYQALRRPTIVNVARGMLDPLGAVPADLTYLRNPADGTIYEILGGAKHPLTAEQWAARGDVTFTNVPRGFLDRIPTAP
jgi:hypothetical protein